MAKKNDKEDFFSGWTAVIIGLIGVVLVCFLAQKGVEYFQGGEASSSSGSFLGSSTAVSEEVQDEDEDIKKAKQMKATENSQAENDSDKSKDKNKSSAEEQAAAEKNSKQNKKPEQDEKLSIQDKIAISNQKLQEGRNFFAERNLTNALESFDQAVKIYALNAAAWTEHGKVCVEMKNFEQALRDFNKAVEVDSTYADAYTQRGLYYQAFGDDEKAQADFAMSDILSKKQ